MATQLRENPRLVAFQDLLYRAKGRIAAILSDTITIDKFYNLGLSTVGRNTDLLSCSLPSIVRALIIAGQLGLDPTGVLGEAYVVPYKKTATFIIGYRGLMELARRSGEVTGIESHVVYEKDYLEISQGTNAGIVHRPTLKPDRGELIGVYAILRTRNGAPIHEWMPKEDVDAIRRRSRAGESGPWSTDYPMMARKTVLRRLLKYAPLKIEAAQTAIEREDQFEERGEEANADILPDIEFESIMQPSRTKSDEMAERLRGARTESLASQDSPAEGTGAAPSEDQTSLLPDNGQEGR